VEIESKKIVCSYSGTVARLFWCAEISAFCRKIRQLQLRPRLGNNLFVFCNLGRTTSPPPNSSSPSLSRVQFHLESILTVPLSSMVAESIGAALSSRKRTGYIQSKTRELTPDLALRHHVLQDWLYWRSRGSQICGTFIPWGYGDRFPRCGTGPAFRAAKSLQLGGPGGSPFLTHGQLTVLKQDARVTTRSVSVYSVVRLTRLTLIVTVPS